jgi:hypothetical protein
MASGQPREAGQALPKGTKEARPLTLDYRLLASRSVRGSMLFVVICYSNCRKAARRLLPGVGCYCDEYLKLWEWLWNWQQTETAQF